MNTRINKPLQAKGSGLFCYNTEPDAADQYGLPSTITTILKIARMWNADNPLFPMQVGDISRRYGAPFPPHAGHRTGREFDMRPFRVDGLCAPIDCRHEDYSSRITEKFLVMLHAHAQVDHVLFNDTLLVAKSLCLFFKGHFNHLHVRLR